MKTLPALLLATALLTACATPLLPDCTRFGRDGQVCLLPPAVLPAMDGTRLVTLVRDGRRDTFIGQLHIDAAALRLAGSSLFGTGLFTLDYDGQAVRVQPENRDLPADKLLVMLELALADPAALRPRLHGLDLKVSTDQGEEVRQVSEHGRLLARVVREAEPISQAAISIEVPPLGLSVDMQPLQQAPPSP